ADLATYRDSGTWSAFREVRRTSGTSPSLRRFSADLLLEPPAIPGGSGASRGRGAPAASPPVTTAGTGGRPVLPSRWHGLLPAAIQAGTKRDPRAPTAEPQPGQGSWLTISRATR